MLKEFNVGKMHVRCFETRKEMGDVSAKDAAAAIKKVIAEKGECNAIFAAAPSQNDFLASLAADTSIDWTKVNAYHMDEYIGLPSDAPQGFGNFLKEAIFGKVPFKSVNYLGGGAEDIDAEIKRYEELLKTNKPDMVFMGIGENGHIAFNDPHVAHFDDDCLVKKVELDAKCRQQQVNDGCFAAFDDVPTHALTLTIPALMLPEYIFCIVPAPTKADAVKNTCLGIITEQVPATILRLHENSELYLDKDSGKYIL